MTLLSRCKRKIGRCFESSSFSNLEHRFVSAKGLSLFLNLCFGIRLGSPLHYQYSRLKSSAQINYENGIGTYNACTTAWILFFRAVIANVCSRNSHSILRLFDYSQVLFLNDLREALDAYINHPKASGYIWLFSTCRCAKLLISIYLKPQLSAQWLSPKPVRQPFYITSGALLTLFPCSVVWVHCFEKVVTVYL